MGKICETVLVVAVLAGMFFFPVEVFPETYKYVDENGTIVLTTDKDSIPEDSRDSAEQLGEETHTDGYKPSLISSALSTTKLGVRKAVRCFSNHVSFIVKIPGFFISHPKDVFAGIWKVGIPFFLMVGVLIISFLVVPQKIYSQKGEILTIIVLFFVCAVVGYFLLRIGLSQHLETLATNQGLDTSQRTMYYLIENIER